MHTRSGSMRPGRANPVPGPGASQRARRRVGASDDAEPIGRQLRITYRVLDVAVAEIGLQSPRVVAFIGYGKAAGVPQHVWMSCDAQVAASADDRQSLPT